MDCRIKSGNDASKRSRGAFASEFCATKDEHAGPDPVGWPPAVGPAPSRSRPDHKIRKAERRQTRMSNLRTRNLHPSPRAGEDRGGGVARVQRDALACRRSTAALAAANQRRRSAPARASWDAADIRRYLKRACPSPASSSQAGHGAGRAFCRGRPRAAVTGRRPQEPHSPRLPASPGDPPEVERDSIAVTQTGTKCQ